MCRIRELKLWKKNTSHERHWRNCSRAQRWDEFPSFKINRFLCCRCCCCHFTHLCRAESRVLLGLTRLLFHLWGADFMLTFSFSSSYDSSVTFIYDDDENSEKKDNIVELWRQFCCCWIGMFNKLSDNFITFSLVRLSLIFIESFWCVVQIFFLCLILFLWSIILCFRIRPRSAYEHIPTELLWTFRYLSFLC